MTFDPSVVALVGSPRRYGNTAHAVGVATQELERRGVSCETVLVCDRQLASPIKSRSGGRMRACRQSWSRCWTGHSVSSRSQAQRARGSIVTRIKYGVPGILVGVEFRVHKSTLLWFAPESRRGGPVHRAEPGACGIGEAGARLSLEQCGGACGRPR